MSLNIQCVSCNQCFTGKSNDTVRTDLLNHISEKHKTGNRILKSDATNQRIEYLYTVQIECQYCYVQCKFVNDTIETILFFLDTHCCDIMQEAKIQQLENDLDREDREEIRRNFCGYGNDI